MRSRALRGMLRLCAVFLIFVCGIYMFSPSPSSVGSSQNLMAVEKNVRALQLGRFGEMMIELVASDLPFTTFVPSEIAFRKLIKTCLKGVDGVDDDKVWEFLSHGLDFLGSEPDAAKGSSFVDKNSDRLTAIVSRIMSFGTVPKQITSAMVASGSELEVESLSGYKLYLTNDERRGFLVNNFTCPIVDVKEDFLLVHVIDGVLMDSAFERSIDFETDVAL